jgi:hypothetical protein
MVIFVELEGVVGDTKFCSIMLLLEVGLVSDTPQYNKPPEDS